MQPLTDAVNFIVLDFELHDEFDEFKKANIQSGISYLEVNELLEFFIDKHQQFTESIVRQYNRTYLKMSASDVDVLVQWTSSLRDSCNKEGSKVFNTGMMYLKAYNYYYNLLFCSKKAKKRSSSE